MRTEEERARIARQYTQASGQFEKLTTENRQEVNALVLELCQKQQEEGEGGSAMYEEARRFTSRLTYAQKQALNAALAAYMEDRTQDLTRVLQRRGKADAEIQK